MKKLPNLEKVIRNLNVSELDPEDGYEFKSPFDFAYDVYDNHICIYDKNEYYSIDYLEELNSELHFAAQEFGFKYTAITEDEIHSALETAIKKDLGKDKYIEWEDNVVMSVYF